LAALMNQQAAMGGKESIGFINPAIYNLGTGSSYTQTFHDITTGDNTWKSSPNAFSAVVGYDLCTGWGTPSGASLIDELAGPADSLNVLAAPPLTTTGPAGGPFSPATTQLVLTNSGPAPLSWSLVNTSAWLNVDSTGGTLALDATATLNLQVTAAAAKLC
jgi:hypothetical protein